MEVVNNKLRVCLLLVFLLSGMHSMQSYGESTEEILKLLQRAKKAPPPRAPDELGWMIGRWDCVARILRSVPPSVEQFVFLLSMEFDKDAIQVSRDFPGGTKLMPDCKFSAHYVGEANAEAGPNIEFYKEGFFWSPPMGIFLKLLSDPDKNPQWFILTDPLTEDVLLFRRKNEKPKKQN